jgi:hypothetical protein
MDVTEVPMVLLVNKCDDLSSTDDPELAARGGNKAAFADLLATFCKSADFNEHKFVSARSGENVAEGIETLLDTIIQGMLVRAKGGKKGSSSSLARARASSARRNKARSSGSVVVRAESLLSKGPMLPQQLADIPFA